MIVDVRKKRKIERPPKNLIEESNMAVTTEIAPNICGVSIFAESANLQFNHFLVKDDEPLLFHTGRRGMHVEIRDAVSKLINLSELRHISFSHFESDECGSLNDWLASISTVLGMANAQGPLQAFRRSG
jgi:flavorubredoxin